MRKATRQPRQTVPCQIREDMHGHLICCISFQFHSQLSTAVQYQQARYELAFLYPNDCRSSDEFDFIKKMKMHDQ